MSFEPLLQGRDVCRKVWMLLRCALLPEDFDGLHGFPVAPARIYKGSPLLVVPTPRLQPVARRGAFRFSSV